LKSLSKAIIISVMILLVGFTVVTNETSENTAPVKGEEVTSLNSNENTTNSSIVNYEDIGTLRASWYGPKFHGKITANGEIFNQMAYTAASKVMKFGTLLKITNPRNNKSVIVRINDRGPYIAGRQLDLSKAAALSLGMMKRGVIKVEVEKLNLKGINSPVITLN
jgi:rare lipoprotein A